MVESVPSYTLVARGRRGLHFEPPRFVPNMVIGNRVVISSKLLVAVVVVLLGGEKVRQQWRLERESSIVSIGGDERTESGR